MTRSEMMYGAFPGGDPRKFHPDEECSTEAERESHRRACAIWDAGAQLGPLEPAHEIVRNEAGEMVMHIARAKFGLGVYEIEIPCETCGDSGVVDTGQPSDSDADATIHAPCPDCGEP
jgi:hypothetical protein